MRYAVTGGAGFIGDHLARSLLADKHEVVGIDSDLEYANIIPGPGYKTEICDIRDFSRIYPMLSGVDTVFHLAAFVSAPVSLKAPKKCFEINVLGTYHLIEAAVKAGVRRIVFASSAAVYGNGNVPNVVGFEGVMSSPYAVSKFLGEQLLRSRKDIESVCLRLFNVYGPHQDEKSAYAAVIPKTLSRISRFGLPPIVYGDGEQTRDIIYVENVVNALVKARAVKVPDKPLNIGTGSPVSVNTLVSLLCEIAEFEGNPKKEPGRPGDIRHSFADISDSVALLGDFNTVSLEEGIRRTVRELQP